MFNLLKRESIELALALVNGALNAQFASVGNGIASKEIRRIQEAKRMKLAKLRNELELALAAS